MAEVQERLYLGLHWLTLNVRNMDYRDVLSVLLTVYGSQFDLKGGARFYDQRWETVDNKITVLSGHKGDGGDLVTVNMTGQACECLDWAGFRNLNRLLHEKGGICNVSRLDYAIDGVPVLVAGFADAVKHGGVDYSAHHAGFESSWDAHRRKDGSRVRDETSTFYIGSGSSQKKLRVYDKRALDGGEMFDEPIPFTRFELQLRDDQAEQFWNLYLADDKYRNGIAVFLSALESMIQVSWTPLRDWLDVALTLFSVYAWPKLDPVVRSVDDKINWLIRSVSKTIAGVNVYYKRKYREEPPDITKMLLDFGNSKLTDRERLFFESAEVA